MVNRKDSVELSQSSSDPRLPAHRRFEDVEPYERAMIWFVCTLPGSWQSIDWNSLTHLQERVMNRVIEAGWVEARAITQASMDGFANRVSLTCRICGKYKKDLRERTLLQMPDWITRDGRTKNYNHFRYDIFGIRLTDVGELARFRWQGHSGNSLLPLLQSESQVPSRVQIEERTIVPIEKSGSSGDSEVVAVDSKIHLDLKEGMSWQAALAEAENFVKGLDGLFPGRNKLAKIIGCASSTMTKAIKNSLYLTARMKEYEQREQRGKPTTRNLSDIDLATIASDAKEDELIRLTEEQAAEEAKDERMHNAARYRRKKQS